jgi:hypothetical protein
MHTAALLLTCVLLPVGASTADGGSHIDVVDVGGCRCLLAPVVVVVVVVVMVNCDEGKHVEMLNKDIFEMRASLLSAVRKA